LACALDGPLEELIKLLDKLISPLVQENPFLNYIQRFIEAFSNQVIVKLYEQLYICGRYIEYIKLSLSWQLESCIMIMGNYNKMYNVQSMST
jgi:hypothetical protein